MRLVTLALVTAFPVSLVAQDRADTARHEARARFYVAGGLELSRLTHFPGVYAQGYGPGAGLSLQAGYARQYRRWGVRWGLGYFERQREYGPSVFGTSEFDHVSTSRTIVANVDLTYDLTGTRVRPYLIGGLAPYWVSVSDRYDSGRKARHNYFGMAVSPGMGLRAPLRSVELLVEARTYFFSGHSHVFSPLTFGVQF